MDLPTTLLWFQKEKQVLTGMLLEPSTVVKGLMLAPTQHSKWPSAGFKTHNSRWEERKNQLDVIS